MQSVQKRLEIPHISFLGTYLAPGRPHSAVGGDILLDYNFLIKELETRHSIHYKSSVIWQFWSGVKGLRCFMIVR